MIVECVCGNKYEEEDNPDITICPLCKCWDSKKLSRVATIPWVKANVKDKEVRSFFVAVLQAKVVK